MSWDASGYGSHAETALTSPSPTWFLAEGATHNTFDLFYLIQNPGPTAATVTVRYLRPAPLAPLTKNYVVAGNSRFTIAVDNEVINGQSLAATDVSAAITSTQPIVVERAMYMTNGAEPYGAGHESAGVTAPALNWFLAEGATGAFFDMFVLIANPDPTNTATVQATYLLDNGTTLTKSYAVAPSSRRTIYVDDEGFPDQAGPRLLANAAVSTILASTNNVPIVVERAMWWPGGAQGPWYEGHNSPGATTTGTVWALAEGEVGGSNGASTYILVANTGATPASVRVTVFVEGGGTAVRTFTVPASSRFNVDVATVFGSTVANARMGALVESLGATPAPIVVERAIYSNAGGRVWAAARTPWRRGSSRRGVQRSSAGWPTGDDARPRRRTSKAGAKPASAPMLRNARRVVDRRRWRQRLASHRAHRFHGRRPRAPLDRTPPWTARRRRRQILEGSRSSATDSARESPSGAPPGHSPRLSQQSSPLQPQVATAATRTTASERPAEETATGISPPPIAR